jgi:hypothetical protein
MVFIEDKSCLSIFGWPAEREVVDALYAIAAHPSSSVDFVRRTRMAGFVSAGIWWYRQDKVLTLANPSRITVFSVAVGLGCWGGRGPRCGLLNWATSTCRWRLSPVTPAVAGSMNDAGAMLRVFALTPISGCKRGLLICLLAL